MPSRTARVYGHVPPPRFDIRPVRGATDLAVAVDLLRAYLAALPIDLSYQDIDEEMAGLPGKYAPPSGELLLAWDEQGAALGCVGLRALAEPGCCEMKRLFLAPEARGRGLGRVMAEAAIATARGLGYAELRLDTLPTMTAAIGLYEAMGFVRIGPYYGPTPDGTVFMSLRL